MKVILSFQKSLPILEIEIYDFIYLSIVTYQILLYQKNNIIYCIIFTNIIPIFLTIRNIDYVLKQYDTWNINHVILLIFLKVFIIDFLNIILLYLL